MAITTINSLAIPAGTVVSADLTYPLTGFSSTGIDDNATSTAITIDSSENVGIGTTNPSNPLNVIATNTNVLIEGSGVSSTGIAFETNNTTRASIGVANASTALSFFSDAGSTETMRIDSSGNLLVGKSVTTLSTVGATFTSSGTSTQTANFAVTNQVHIYNQLDTSGTSQVDFRVAGFSKGRIQWTNTATSYITSSDVRLKENIVDAPAGNIDAIRVRSFDWKADGSHQTYGMVAQELVEVAPEAVSQGDTEDDIWGVDYSKLVPMMIKEIQDLKAEVAALKGA